VARAAGLVRRTGRLGWRGGARPPAGKSGGRGPTNRVADGCQVGLAATAQICSGWWHSLINGLEIRDFLLRRQRERWAVAFRFGGPLLCEPGRKI